MAKKKKKDKYDILHSNCCMSTSRFLDCRWLDILQHPSIYEMIKYCYEVGFLDGAIETGRNEDLHEATAQIAKELDEKK